VPFVNGFTLRRPEPAAGAALSGLFDPTRR
jgi:hypothetical protein